MAYRLPNTSKYSESSEMGSSEKELKKIEAEKRKEYHRILVSSEREKIKNADKLRLRKLPILGSRTPHLAALAVLNNMFNFEITPQDILESQKVPSWDETEDYELLVTFQNQEVRDSVYNKRTKENKGIYMICDELGEERLMIWKKLVKQYGLKRVYTHCGGVNLEIGKKIHRFLTLSELEKFEDLHGYL